MKKIRISVLMLLIFAIAVGLNAAEFPTKKILTLDAAIDEIVPRNTKIHKLAEGFKFTEGPVWIREGAYLLFSDPNNNTIYR